MDNLTALHNHLDNHPDDWDARLVLADMLEEQGLDTQATVQRWMVQHQLRPYFWGERKGWCWFGPNYLPRGGYTVPDQLWAKIVEEESMFVHYTFRASRQEAEKLLEM